MLRPPEESLNGLKLISSFANANHKLDDVSGSMKTSGRAGKKPLSTTNGLQMLPVKKPFWILTPDIKVFNVRKSKAELKENASPPL